MTRFACKRAISSRTRARSDTWRASLPSQQRGSPTRCDGTRPLTLPRQRGSGSVEWWRISSACPLRMRATTRHFAASSRTESVSRPLRAVPLARPVIPADTLAEAREILEHLTAKVPEAYETADKNALLGRCREAGIPLREARGLASLLLVAGTETAASAMARGVALLYDTGQQHDLRAEPDLLPGAVWEILRVTTPAPLIGRHITADVTAAGRVLRRGDRALMLTYTTNNAVGRFDIRRSPSGRFASCGSARAPTSAWERRLPARRSLICSKHSWRKSGHGGSSVAALPGTSSFPHMRSSRSPALPKESRVERRCIPGSKPTGFLRRAHPPTVLMVIFVDTLGYAAIVPLIPFALRGQRAPL